MSGTGGGRRVRVQDTPARPTPRAFAPAVLVVAVTLALLLVAVLLDPAPATGPAARWTSVPRVTTVCPAPSDGDRTADLTGVAAVSAPVGVRAEGDGQRVARGPDGEVPALAGTERAALAGATAPGPVVLSSDGSLAPGAVALTAAVAPNALGGGLTAAACAPAGPSSWFVGVGAADRSTTVLLTNPGGAPAVADLRLYGPQGRVEAVDGTGVVVDSGTTRAVSLADLTADPDGTSLRVVVRRGALVPAVLDAGERGTGTTWAPAAAGPATSQVVPGGLEDAGTSTLQVVNPGARTTTADVTVLGPDGRFAPAGAEQVEVPAGGTVSVDLPAAATRAAYGVAVRSAEPVAAALLSVTDDDRTRTAAAPVLDGAAAVPTAVPAGDDEQARATVAVSNGDASRAARVVVTAYAADGSRAGRDEVEVPSGATVALPSSEAATLVLETSGRAVHAVAVLRAGDGTGTVPLAPAPARVLAPRVTPLR